MKFYSWFIISYLDLQALTPANKDGIGIYGNTKLLIMPALPTSYEFVVNQRLHYKIDSKNYNWAFSNWILPNLQYL